MVQFGEVEDQDVAELEISVDNAHFLMQVDECIGDLRNVWINVQHSELYSLTSFYMQLTFQISSCCKYPRMRNFC